MLKLKQILFQKLFKCEQNLFSMTPGTSALYEVFFFFNQSSFFYKFAYQGQISSRQNRDNENICSYIMFWSR